MPNVPVAIARPMPAQRQHASHPDTALPLG